jgi:hypothetical protein
MIAEYLPLSIYVVMLSAVSAPAGKFFERRMDFLQHWLTCLVAWGAVTILSVSYFTAKQEFSLSPPLDGVVVTFFIIVGGILITRFAYWKYGIEKTGWFGLGAKVMLAFVTLSWVLTGIGYVVSTFVTT